MSLLIDGYNVLHVVGILGRAGPGSLERARMALLNFLAESIPPEQVPHTTVVFDGRDAPPGLPAISNHRGLTVQFARRDSDADSVIEELIGADSAPRRLTVVSSDHRLQRAARRRRARAVDSDRWYAEIVQQRRARRQSTAAGPPRPKVPLLEEDVNYWVRQFGGEALLDQIAREQAVKGSPPPGQSSDKPRHSPEPCKELPPDLENPFPPGYAEDVTEEGLGIGDWGLGRD
ncbi:MAG: NYN domain-containing protein [Thermoguttaceae bacterium]